MGRLALHRPKPVLKTWGDNADAGVDDVTPVLGQRRNVTEDSRPEERVRRLEFPLMDVHSQGHHGASDVEVVGEGEDGDEQLPDLEGAVIEQLHRLLRQVALETTF